MQNSQHKIKRLSNKCMSFTEATCTRHEYERQSEQWERDMALVGNQRGWVMKKQCSV